MELEPRDTQTQVKHMILAEYMDRWGRIIINGLRSLAAQKQSSGRKFNLHFVYVDCFAYKGRYAGNAKDVLLNRSPQHVFGSPIIGIQALDRLVNYAHKAGINLQVNAIAVEKNSENFEALRDSLLLAGFEQRVRETTMFSNLKPGEIAIANRDSVALVDDFLACTTKRYTWAFYLLDPYGPSGIPHKFVQSIVQQEHHDVMINFPYLDLERKTGAALSDRLQPKHQQLVGYWTGVFGSEEWIGIASLVTRGRSLKDALWEVPLDDMEEGSLLANEQLSKERELVDLYRTVLRRMDPKLAVKLVDLLFPDKERTMFYLFLTTHDPTGALSLNEILLNAKLWEYELRYLRRFAKKTAPPPGQLSLFTMEPNVPEPQAPSRPTEEEVAEDMMQRFAGRIVKRRDVYRELADEIYFPIEVDRALRFLRKKKRASFTGELAHDTLIEFSKG